MYMPTYRQVGSDVEFVAENLVYGSLDKDKNRWVEVMLMVREKGKDGPWQVAEVRLPAPALELDGSQAPIPSGRGVT